VSINRKPSYLDTLPCVHALMGQLGITAAGFRSSNARESSTNDDDVGLRVTSCEPLGLA
jgi:hypothetical protein